MNSSFSSHWPEWDSNQRPSASLSSALTTRPRAPPLERWQSANKGLTLGSVKYQLGSIDGVETSRVEVVLDWITTSGLGRPLGIFQPWMFGLKSKTLRTGREDGMRCRCPNQRRRRCLRRDDAVGCLVHSRMLLLLMCCCQNTRRRRLCQRMSNTSRRQSARVVAHASEP